MKTLELVKSKISSLTFESSYEEKNAACPVLKRQRVDSKMTWILQNPETKKWVAITDEEMESLNEQYNAAKLGENKSYLF